MATSSVVNALRQEDGRIASSFRYLVGVPHGGVGANAVMGPASYAHRRDPPIVEKMAYGQVLTNITPTPIVNVTDEDVKAMEEKAWMAKLKDFNDWVGSVYKPQDSPANQKVLSEVYPEWLEMQKQEIDNWHDMKKRIEHVKLKGPENKEDLFLMYRLGWPNRTGQQIMDIDFSERMRTQQAPGLATAGQGWRAVNNVAQNFQRGLWGVRKSSLTEQALRAGVFARRDGGMGAPLHALRDLPPFLMAERVGAGQAAEPAANMRAPYNVNADGSFVGETTF